MLAIIADSVMKMRRLKIENVFKWVKPDFKQTLSSHPVLARNICK
jgi:hypothetical protein